MNRPGCFSPEHLNAGPVLGPLHHAAYDLKLPHARTITTRGIRFGFQTSDPRTASLLDAIWAGHIEAGAGSAPRIFAAPIEGLQGRFVDAQAQTQVLSFDYTPFTFVKQSLRWAYACESVRSGLLPLHGVIVNRHGRNICISGRGQAGKSFLAERLLCGAPEARIIVDDWSLLDARERQIIRVGDASLHVRGNAFDDDSVLLRGANPSLVELCGDDPRSNESRFLVPRADLPIFDQDAHTARGLHAVVLLRSPFNLRFVIDDTRRAIETAFAGEAATFWDDSLIGLPGVVIDYLREAWARLLSEVPALVMEGHRTAPIGEVTRKLQEALDG